MQTLNGTTLSGQTITFTGNQDDVQALAGSFDWYVVNVTGNSVCPW